MNLDERDPTPEEVKEIEEEKRKIREQRITSGTRFGNRHGVNFGAGRHNKKGGPDDSHA